jgi:hypothetical protein
VVTQNYVELSNEVALARYCSVQAHNESSSSPSSTVGSARLLLKLPGRVLENGYVTIEAIEA